MSELEDLLYKIKVKRDKTKDNGIRERLNTSIKITEEIEELI